MNQCIYCGQRVYGNQIHNCFGINPSTAGGTTWTFPVITKYVYDTEVKELLKEILARLPKQKTRKKKEAA